MRFSRRKFLMRAAAVGAIPLALGGYGTGIEVHWLDTHEVPIALPRLAKQFDGFRIAHLTDLHAADNVSPDYLRHVVDVVNAQRPDLTVITGDFTTHRLKWVGPICKILSNLKSPALATLGNHDYDECAAFPGVPTTIADRLSENLKDIGIPLLRNRLHVISRGDAKLNFVGLEDIHSGYFDPQRAFFNVPSDEAIITLSHNPDSVPQLDDLCRGLILCGHTHGGQVRIPFIGAPILPISNRQWDEGYFQLQQSQMYVSRGIGHLLRVRLFCRPELPIYRLQAV